MKTRASFLHGLILTLTACLGTHPEPTEAPERGSPAEGAAADAMIVVPGLLEPLVPMGPTTPSEDEAIASAVDAYRELGTASVGEEASWAPFERFVREHPGSPWTVGVLTNLGLAYYRTGYFSRALEAWQTAWEQGRHATGVQARALVDRAIGELARMRARVGHAEELEALFEDLGDRPITGSAAELLVGAREGAWVMRKEPGRAFLCGPNALGNTLRALGTASEDMAFVHEARSGSRGFSLTQLSQLAHSGGLSHRLIHRAPGQAIPVPSVVNWRVDHYAAIVSEEDGRYLIQDPTFGGDLVVSRAAIDAEASGYFLVPIGAEEDPDWREVHLDEADGVFGMGFTSESEPGATSSDDVKIGGACGDPGLGMCVPDAHAMTVSLSLNDTPVGYAPQKGPPVYIRLTYNQREAGQPQSFGYFNVGQSWTLSVLSFVEDTPAIPPSSGTVVKRILPGGGYREHSGFDTTTGGFAPEKQTGAVLLRAPATGTATSYTLTENDGSRLVYGRSDGALTGTRRMFLSAVIDPQGNAITLSYDASNRLTDIYDATGRRTRLAYELTWSPRLLTRITDPFGRSAMLGYANGRLEAITDVLGIVSRFTYDAIGKVTALTTPYGTSRFSFGESYEPGTFDRHLEITDPMGRTERLEFTHSSGVGGSETAVPVGMSATTQYLSYRNSFYWDKHVYPLSGRDFTKAKVWHWLHTPASKASPILESVKEPLEGRVWLNYPGQSSVIFEGTSAAVTAAGRVLDDGSSQVFKKTYNSRGKLLAEQDPLGRTTEFQYAADGIDLMLVRQKLNTVITGGSGGTTLVTNYATLAQYHGYNAQRRPLAVTDAAGRLWSYAYNAAGQVTSVTDPLGRVMRLNYDGYGRLVSVVNANNAVVLQHMYLASCESANSDRTNCEFPIATTDSEGRTIGFGRDPLDRIREVRYVDGTRDVYEYTLLDLTAHVDRMGRRTIYAYFPDRRLRSVTNPLGQTVSYEYHGNGELAKLTDEKGNVTRWELDDQGRVKRKIFADGRTFTYGYEATTSRLKTITDALGQVKILAYNRDDTLATIKYSSTINPTPTVGFTYDPYFRRPTVMGDGRGSTSWTYVPPGSPGALSVLTEYGPLFNDDVSYSYDELGRVTSRNVGDRPTEAWQYDTIGRVARHVTELGIFDYSYLGQTAAPIRRTLAGSSRVTTWSYDTNVNDRRLIGIDNGPGAQSFTLGYQRFGGQAGVNPYQVTRVSQTAGGLPAQTSCYRYDDAGRLLTVSRPTASGGTCDQALTALYTYASDPAGNLTTFTGSSGTVGASYNNLNQIATQGSRSFVFDAAGNLTSDGTRKFKWDAENRLTQVWTGSTLTASYAYDGLGRRAAIAVAGQPTRRFTFCGSEVCAARGTDDRTHTRYYAEGQYHPGVPSFPNGTVGQRRYLFASDHLGTVRNVIDLTSSAVADSYRYTPYGQLEAGSTTNVPIDFMYAGLLRDRALGLDYSKTRLYDPSVGRWTSRDPIAEAGGINPYAYADGDPINRIDPNGTLAWIPLAGGAFGAGAQAWANYDAYRCGRISGSEYAWSIGFGFLAGAAATLPTGLVGGAIAGSAGSGLNEAFNVGIGAKDASPSDFAQSVALGGLAGLGANGLGKLGGHLLRGESVIGQTVPLASRPNYGELGGAIGTGVGTSAATLAGE